MKSNRNLDKLRQALCLTDGTTSQDLNKTKLAFKILNVIKELFLKI